MLFVMAIIFSVLLAVFLVCYVLIDKIDFLTAVVLVAFITVFEWSVCLIVRRNAPKNAEKYFKYNNVDGVVEYSYELMENEFIVSQPLIGNVSHFKYDMILSVTDVKGFVTVMLATNQFLPIILNDDTADLVYALKSHCKTQ